MKSKSKYRYFYLILFIFSQCIFLLQINFSYEFQLGNVETPYLDEVNRREINPFRSSSPILISNYTEGIGNAKGVFIQDDVLFLTDTSYGSMTAINVSNPVEPKYLDWFQSAETITSGAFIEENIAYLPSNFGLEILDVSDPSTIDWISWYDDEYMVFTNDVIVSEDIAYISRANDAFEIVNMSNPNNPEKINQIEGNYYEIMIRENYAYVIEDTIALNIIDISDPTNSSGTFQIVKRIEFGEIRDIFFKDDVMYLVEPTEGLFVYNIANPINPQYITLLDMGGDWQGNKACIEKDIAYISTLYGDVKIVNASDPNNLDILDGYVGDGGSGNDIVVEDCIIYMADGDYGLKIIDSGIFSLEAPFIINTNMTVNQPTIEFEWLDVKDAEYYNIYINGLLNTSTQNTWIQLTFNSEGTRVFTVTAVSGLNESEHSNPLEIIIDFSYNPFDEFLIIGFPFEIFGLFFIFAVTIKFNFLLKKKKFQ